MLQEISCQVCQDLMPLVKDDIASQDSKNLVLAHIQNCETCLSLWGNKSQPQPSYNEQAIVKNIKLVVISWSAVVVLFALFIGIAISQSQQGYALAVISLPVIGVLSYVLLKKYWLISPTLIFLGLMAVQARVRLRDTILGNFFAVSVDEIVFDLMIAALTAVGIWIYLLLKFAFSKEDYHD